MGTGYGEVLQVLIGRSIHISHVSISPNNYLWLALSLGIAHSKFHLLLLATGSSLHSV